VSLGTKEYNLTATEAAWLAGYIDGDGCVSLTTRSGHAARSPEIAIDSCDRELIDRVQVLVGGYACTKKVYNERHRIAWHWRLHGSLQVVSVLRIILPFMCCADKIARAKLLVDEWAACTPRNGFYTAEMLASKDALEERFLAIGYRRGIRQRTTAPPPPSQNLRMKAQKMARGPRGPYKTSALRHI
jgi:LAGLIDADG DNA endonuclease family protein